MSFNAYELRSSTSSPLTVSSSIMYSDPHSTAWTSQQFESHRLPLDPCFPVQDGFPVQNMGFPVQNMGFPVQSMGASMAPLPRQSFSGYVAPSRTVYLGNIPQDLSANELLNHVRCGPVEDVHIVHEKMCAFVSFVDESSAMLFHSDAILKRLQIRGRYIKIGWGKSSEISSELLYAINAEDVSRCVYIGRLAKNAPSAELSDLCNPSNYQLLTDHCQDVNCASDEDDGYAAENVGTISSPASNYTDENTGTNMKDLSNNNISRHEEDQIKTTKTTTHRHPIESLAEDLSIFGTIEHIKYIAEKGIAFIHFTSIFAAMDCVANVHSIPRYHRKKIGYGKDRCAFITKTQQHNAAQYLGLANGMEHLVTNSDREFISNTLLQQSAQAAAVATTSGGTNNLGNRTVYLGNLPKVLRVEDICNVVRGGSLQSIKYLHDRHVCFVTFIDPTSAAQFFAMASLQALKLHGRQCIINWGKHSGPLPNSLALAVANGASRNIYLGNIDVRDAKFHELNLRPLVEQFGEVEQINYLPAKRCVFVNYTNIKNALVAVEKFREMPEFKGVKINFGKDRCGNIPKQTVE